MARLPAEVAPPDTPEEAPAHDAPIEAGKPAKTKPVDAAPPDGMPGRERSPRRQTDDLKEPGGPAKPKPAVDNA